MSNLSKPFAAGIAVLILTACGTAELAPQGTWTMQVSATSGAALIRTDNGSEALRIACRRNPPDLMVATPRLAGRGGPARLQIGKAAFGLQGDADSPVLSATGSLGASLPAALTSGGAIVVYRGEAAETFGVPDAATARAFASACESARTTSQ